MAYYSKRFSKPSDSSYRNYERDSDRYKQDHSYYRYDRNSPRRSSYSRERPTERLDRSPKNDRNEARRYYKDSEQYSSKNRRDYGGQKKEYYVSSYKSTHYEGKYRDRSKSKKDYRSPSGHKDRRRPSRQRRNSRERRSQRSSDGSSGHRRSRERRHTSKSHSRSREYRKNYDTKPGLIFDSKWKDKEGSSSRINVSEKKTEQRVHQRRDGYREDRYERRDDKREQRRDQKREERRDDKGYYQPHYRPQNKQRNQNKYSSNDYQKIKLHYPPETKTYIQEKLSVQERPNIYEFKKTAKQMEIQKPILQIQTSAASIVSFSKVVPTSIPPPPPPQSQLKISFQPTQTSSYINKFQPYKESSHGKIQRSRMQIEPSLYTSQIQQVLPLPPLNEHHHIPINNIQNPKPQQFVSTSKSQFNLLLQKAKRLRTLQYPISNFLILQAFRGFDNPQYQLQQLDHGWLQKLNQEKKNINLHRAEFIQNVKENPHIQSIKGLPLSTKIFKPPTVYSSKPQVDEKVIYRSTQVSRIFQEFQSRKQSLSSIERKLTLLQADISKAQRQKERIQDHLKSIL